MLFTVFAFVAEALGELGILSAFATQTKPAPFTMGNTETKQPGTLVYMNLRGRGGAFAFPGCLVTLVWTGRIRKVDMRGNVE